MTVSNDNNFSWFKWASEIQSISQNGLTFAQSEYDKERYLQLQNIAAHMMASLSDMPVEKILDLFVSQQGYATPKVDVRGAIFKEDQVLLVKESADGLWTLPGGWADRDYSPAYCVQKEIFEESGYEANVLKLIALYDKWKHAHPKQWPHTYKCFFLCEITGGEPRTSIETQAVSFFPISALPALSLPRVTGQQIMRCYEHYLAPHLPTDFD
ncbi:MAG: NUDIX hydrolase [Proteobacteria bacterium]|nr:NUDIX hydrolase [Pseudomonadota bacterium]